MIQERDANDVIITQDEFSFGGRLEPHKTADGWFICLSLPNGKHRLTAVPNERDAKRLIDETLDLLTRVVVLRDGAGEVVLEGTVYEVATWLECDYNDGLNILSYRVTDKGETFNGDAWLRRICWAGEWF
jgi:hypothetical protein